MAIPPVLQHWLLLCEPIEQVRTRRTQTSSVTVGLIKESGASIEAINSGLSLGHPLRGRGQHPRARAQSLMHLCSDDFQRHRIQEWKQADRISSPGFLPIKAEHSKSPTEGTNSTTKLTLVVPPFFLVFNFPKCLYIQQRLSFSSELSRQSLSPSHLKESGTHLPLSQVYWSVLHVGWAAIEFFYFNFSMLP